MVLILGDAFFGGSVSGKEELQRQPGQLSPARLRDCSFLPAMCRLEGVATIHSAGQETAYLSRSVRRWHESEKGARSLGIKHSRRSASTAKLT